jgi:hypothetical protein
MIKGLSKEDQADFARVVADSDLAVQTFFRIKNMAGEVVPFRYNRAQHLHQQRGTAFDFVLKARKLGVSTRRFAKDLWKCATEKGQHRIMLAQTDEDKDKLFTEKIKPLIDNCRIPLGCVQRADYLYFPATDSRYYVGTAGSKKFGRGSDINGYHFPEYAHWAKPDVATGVEEGLVEGADGLIETTANGHNFAKIEWDRAKKGESKYRAIFLPWFVHQGYVRDPSEIGILSETEQRLINELGMALEQVAWRRHKLKSMRDPGLFPQEYPETDQEAFLSSGRPVFDWISLLRAKNLTSKPKWRGYLVQRHDRIELVPDPAGPLRVWKIPEPGHVYAIGSDVAEGLEGGAYSTGEVLDVGDGEQVAEWHGHIAPDLLDDVLMLLSDWYNFALIIPEAWPGPGAVTMSGLERKRARVWQKPEALRAGFETTAHSKPLMVSSLVAAIRDLQFTPRSPELLEECHSFVYDAKGHMVPSTGNFSDRVMGMGIAWYCTRDLASRVDYYRARHPSEAAQALRPGTSVPRRAGPIPGRRRE